MRYQLHESRKAVWSQRVALLFLVLFAIAFGLHRIGELPTPVAMKLFGLAIAGAAIAVVLGAVALISIWREGFTGAGKAAFGLLFGGLILAGPLWSLPSLLTLPRLHEVSTDIQSPPPFLKLAEFRTGPGTNSVKLQPEEALLQAKAYPDIKPLPIDRPTADAYSAVREAVKNLNWRIVAENPPANGKSGSIEATDRSMIFGFTDDVAIRVTGGNSSARLDVRSSSRHGDHDLGRNAERVRVLFSEVKTRLSEIDKNETMEKAVVLRDLRVKKALEKKEKERQEAEREERRAKLRAAALTRERQISSSGTSGLDTAQPQSAQSRPASQDGQGLNKRQRRAMKTQSLRRFWEQLGQW